MTRNAKHVDPPLRRPGWAPERKITLDASAYRGQSEWKEMAERTIRSCPADYPMSLLRLLLHLLSAPANLGLDEGIDVAIEHTGRISHFDVSPCVLHHLVRVQD